MFSNRFFSLLVLAAAQLISTCSHAQTYIEEISRAENTSVTTDTIEVGSLNLGEIVIGSNSLQLSVTNLANADQYINVRAFVFIGLGEDPIINEEKLSIEANTHRVFSASFDLKRLTPFSRISITVHHLPTVESQKEEWQRIYRTSAFFGVGNPDVDLDFQGLTRKSSDRIDSYFIDGSLAQKEIAETLAKREEAITRIGGFLNAPFEGRIKLFLYSDEKIKLAHTGHQGFGWAYGDFIAEVYNEETKLDPFHELAHIQAGQLGRPPAFLDEGFATYISETFGWDALEYIGAPGRSVDSVSAELLRSDQTIPIKQLMAVENVGSTFEQGRIEYPQSASLVKFIIETYGSETFGELFRSLRPAADADSQQGQENLTRMRDILGVSAEELEANWALFVLANN